jgi:hypothetical protein
MKPNILTLLVLASVSCLGVLPRAQAVTPSPDGCYPPFTTAEGCDALSVVTSGIANTGVGFASLHAVTTGSYNTGVGAGALILNTGDFNTAVGTVALLLNTTGTQNTAVGTDALAYNDIGSYNTATGYIALQSNTTGVQNCAFGWGALHSNTDAANNTAVGVNALGASNAGANTAVGYHAMYNNQTGDENTAVGAFALNNSAQGGANVAVGYLTLSSADFGNSLTAVGDSALVNNTDGNANTAIGSNAGSNVTTADDVICIGADVAGANVDNSCFIGSIRNATTQINDAIPVYIDSANQLGTMSSSRRYKTDIKLMANASESILALKPVTFRYNVHKDRTPHFGLIAEEVAEVNPNLVVYDKEGRPYSVRYDAVNAMLLNEFLKEHKTVENQGQTIARLDKQLETVTATLQKVSARLELNKPAPQTVLNDE